MKDMKKIIVAIDGFSSSGKSTMAKALARKVGYKYIDSGAMYRAVTLYAIRHFLVDEDGKIDVEDLVKALPDIHIDFRVDPETGVSHTYLNGQDVESDIRTMQVAQLVSPVAAIPAVRHALTQRMQEFGREKGIVMDGRDIGTTVFPHAEMKVFVDASPEERARRRTLELEQKGHEVDYNVGLANIKERDHIDYTRKESPLRKAEDAHVLCNDAMNLEEQEKWMDDLFHSIAG